MEIDSTSVPFPRLVLSAQWCGRDPPGGNIEQAAARELKGRPATPRSALRSLATQAVHCRLFWAILWLFYATAILDWIFALQYVFA